MRDNDLHKYQLISILLNTADLVFYGSSVQQNSSGLKFSKSRTGSNVTYSCIIIRVVLLSPYCAFVAFLCLPFITTNHAAYILTKYTNKFA